MAGSPLEDVTNAVKDAAYVSVGLGVIAFQRMQVRRNDLARSLGTSADEARGTLATLTNLIAERVKVIEEQVEAARSELGDRLPGRG